MAPLPSRVESARRRARAIELRREGLSYRQIRALLGGSMATLSGWLRDVPISDVQRSRLRQRSLDAVRRTARANHERRLAREAHIRQTTAVHIGQMSERDLFIAGVVAYAAEGTKKKPWQTSMAVKFTNSDPRMILLFLGWLSLLGVGRSSLSFRVAIHKDADVESALRFWSDVVGVPTDLFKRTVLKRGNPKTTRRWGAEYHGCLVVGVYRSGDLNKQLDGWFSAMSDNLAGLTPSTLPSRPPSAPGGPEILIPPIRGGVTAARVALDDPVEVRLLPPEPQVAR